MTDATQLAFSLIQQPVVATVMVAVGLAGILKVANEFMRLRSNLREKPEPREVQEEARTAGHSLSERITELDGRVDMVEAAHESLDAQVAGHERELAYGRERETACAGRLHKRLDEQAIVLNRMDGKVEEGMKHITASLSEVRTIVLNRRNP